MPSSSKRVAPRSPRRAPRTEARPKAPVRAFICHPVHCGFDRVDGISMFDALSGVRALPSDEVSNSHMYRRLGTRRGYESDDLMAIATVGYHYLRSGGARLAQVIFEGLSAVRPEEAYFWLALGLTHDHLDQPREARAAYRRVFRLDSADATPELNLAELDIAAGEIDAACRRLALGKKKSLRSGQATLLEKANALLSFLDEGAVASLRSKARAFGEHP